VLHGGNISAFSKKYNLNREDILDFSSNINNLFYPKEIEEILKESFPQITQYPELEQEELREIIAQREGINLDNIILGNGSIELIYLIANFLSPCKAKIIVPAFGEYQRALKGFGSRITLFRLLEEEEFRLDLDRLYKDLEEEIIFICNPNNPTGGMIEEEYLDRLIDFIRKKRKFLVLDEAFIDFVEDGFSPKLKAKILNGEDIFIIRSLTKFYGLAGLRIGYALGKKELIERLNLRKPPWNINCFAYQVGLKLLKNKEIPKKIKEKIRKEREFLSKELSKIEHLKLFESKTNFILIKLIHPEVDVKRLQERLAEYKIMIRDSENLNLDSSFFRISIKSNKENKILINSLREILN
jgi:threonine-phosphate decarboxylase